MIKYQSKYTGAEIESILDSVMRGLGEGGGDGGGSFVSMITSTDATAPNDTQPFSSLRSSLETTKAKSYLEQVISSKIDELDKKKLSKLYPDEARGLITFNSGIIVKEQAKPQVLAMRIQEEGDLSEYPSVNILEDGDIAASQLNYNIQEVSASSFGETLGALGNVSDSVDAVKDVEVVLSKAKGSTEWTELPISFLTQAQDVSMTVSTVSPSSYNIIYGDSYSISFNFSSVFNSDKTPTGAGIAYVYVNNALRKTMTISQGVTEVDVTAYLQVGINNIRVKIVDAFNFERPLYYEINSVMFQLESNFLYEQPYTTGNVPFRYTPKGTIDKTIYAFVDGVALEPFVLKTQEQQTLLVNNLTNGVHSVRMYMKGVINNQEITSNELYYEFLYSTSSNTNVLISSNYRASKANVYEQVEIPYIVYNPNATITSIQLLSNNSVISTLNVDSTLKKWLYTFEEVGTTTLTIKAGSVTKTFTFEVEPAEIDIKPVESGLELFLTAKGRSNSDANKSEWKYNTVSSTLSNFNFNTNGWLQDSKGDAVLRINNGARVSVPFKIFERDFKTYGKTIEIDFAVRDVASFNESVLSSIQNNVGINIVPQLSSFSTKNLYGNSAINTFFKDEDRLRISYVITSRDDFQFIYTYLNGILCSAKTYLSTDFFNQELNKAVGISLGNDLCTLDVYNIRVYETSLTQKQVLDNFIYDLNNYKEKFDKAKKNSVVDGYGIINTDALLQQIPCMFITGELPPAKGSKRNAVVEYINKQDESKSFKVNVSNDVQGTSSATYPRKNYKWKATSDFLMTYNGSTSSKYALADGEKAVNCFCLKADFAESSGTHNTGTAKLVNDILKELEILTPPQVADKTVRTTIYGFPICLFQRNSENDSYTFVGKYNFNNDKSTQETFGFTGNDDGYSGACECWEFCNNNSQKVLFNDSDFSIPNWYDTDFVNRYPDDDGINADYEDNNKTPTALKGLLDWMLVTKNNDAKFLAEFNDRFDRDTLLFYYCFTELMGMVDQRAKNMFLATWDGFKWYTVFYDNDTILGINNQGAISYRWDIEYHTLDGSGFVWNGEKSELWNRIERLMQKDIKEMYQRIRGKANYNRFIEMYNVEQAEKWCEAIYNLDAKYKYIEPYTQDGEGAYIYAAQGDRKDHRKYWLYNRFKFMDSKYIAGDYKEDNVTMRIYTPTNPVVAPNYNFTLEVLNEGYYSANFGGNYTEPVKATVDVKKFTLIAPTGITFNNTEAYVYGASNILDIGDLSPMYVGTFNCAKAKNLRKVKLGSQVSGYVNLSLSDLELGANTMLEEVDISNCPNVSGSLDLSKCTGLKKLYMKGTTITSVDFPQAGVLTEIVYPDTVTSISLKNQYSLTNAGFKYGSLANIEQIILENTPNINTLNFIEECIVAGNIKFVRLIGVNDILSNASMLFELYESNVGGIDINGNQTERMVIEGKVHIVNISQQEKDVLLTMYPPEAGLIFTFGTISNLEPVVADFDVSLSSQKTFTIENAYNRGIRWISAGGRLYVLRENYNLSFTLQSGISSIQLGTDYSRDIRFSQNTDGALSTFALYVTNVRTFKSSIYSYSFTNCTSLESVSDLFNSGSTNGSFVGCFSGCTKLKTIHKDLFKGRTTADNLSLCFKECTSIVTIPSGLFDSLTNVTTLTNLFTNCTSLTSIPSGLFDYCTKATTFFQAFSGCSSLTSTPLGLFDKNTLVTNFRSTFMYTGKIANSYNCTSVGLPKLWERTVNGVAVDGTYFALGAGATFQANIPQSWGGNLKTETMMSIDAPEGTSVEFEELNSSDQPMMMAMSLDEPKIEAATLGNGQKVASLDTYGVYKMYVNGVYVKDIRPADTSHISLGTETVPISVVDDLIKRIESLENK